MKMYSRDQLKIWLTTNAFSKNGRVNSKRLHKFPPEVLEYTNFLDKTCKYSERIYCILNDITKQVLCGECNNPTAYHTRHGGYYSQYCSTKCMASSPKVRNKSKTTCLERYGVENPFQDKELIKNACLTKFGVDNPSQRHLSKKQLTLLHDINWLVKENQTKPMRQIAYEIGVTGGAVENIFKRHNIQCLSHRCSFEQQLVHKYVESLLPNTDIIRDDRTQLRPYELDIWIPSLNSAIEYNGSYWHTLPGAKRKHEEKRKRCKDKGIDLFYVWDYEFFAEDNTDIKNRIRNFLEEQWQN